MLPATRKKNNETYIVFIPDKKRLGYRNVPKLTWGGAASGAGQGAALGATVGSVFPGAGTAIGAAVGAVGGTIIGGITSSNAAARRKRLLAKQRRIRWKAQDQEREATLQDQYQSDENQLANLKLVDDNDLFMAEGGSVKRTKAPRGNVLRLGNGAELLLNDEGSTSGTHESGQNIPLKKNGNTVAYAEPGEVIVDDTVLSKRLGFADAYLQLENAKENATQQVKDEINKEQRMLPKYNKQLIKKLGAKPLAFNGMDLSNVMGTVGTIGNLMMSNDALRDQEKMVKEGMAVYNSYRPSILKHYNLSNVLDVSAETNDINQGYVTSISGLDGIDPAIASALKNNANVKRIGQLGKVYEAQRNYSSAINNQNIQTLFEINRTNSQILSDAAKYRNEGTVSGLTALSNIRGQRLSNFQSAFAEFNNMIQQNNALESIQSIYKNDIGDDNLPTSGINGINDSFNSLRMGIKKRINNRRSRILVH